jgi:hypothetical protein
MSYFIRDLGIGYGTFIRLDFPLVNKNVNFLDSQG